jgi:cation-transporting P-type ATPase F
LNEVLALPKTDPKRGLSLFDVQGRVTRFGPNVLTQRKHKIPWLNFLEQFKNPLIFIYLAASVSTFFQRRCRRPDSIVVLINAIIGFVQESKGKRLLRPCLSP